MQTSEQAWNAYTTFKNGRKLSDMGDADLAEALRLHEAFLAADSVVRVRSVNTQSIMMAIDHGGKGEIETESGPVDIQATYVEGSREALGALADWIEAAADSNIEERQQGAIDYGTSFCDVRIVRMVKAAEKQAEKVRAAL